MDDDGWNTVYPPEKYSIPKRGALAIRCEPIVLPAKNFGHNVWLNLPGGRTRHIGPVPFRWMANFLAWWHRT